MCITVFGNSQGGVAKIPVNIFESVEELIKTVIDEYQIFKFAMFFPYYATRTYFKGRRDGSKFSKPSVPNNSHQTFPPLRKVRKDSRLDKSLAESAYRLYCFPVKTL